jgi:hypothetical protein
VFQLNMWKAWGAVVTSIVAMSASLYLISVSPWYLLPFAWFVAGTAFTGFFVIGHDCGHRSFSENKLLEDIVGTLAFMPLIYPFEPWRIKHNQHHAQTNKCAFGFFVELTALLVVFRGRLPLGCCLFLFAAAMQITILLRLYLSKHPPCPKPNQTKPN